MTAAQDRRNPFTLTLWGIAGLLVLVGLVLIIVGFAQATPGSTLDNYDADRGALFFQLGTVVAAAGAVLAGMPLAVWAVAREHGVR